MSIPIQVPPAQAPAPVPGGALWALGFRPFYLLAAALAVLSVPLWALQFGGWLGTPVLRGAAWHGHEMVFGYALAVLIGFLFTAGRNWSGQPTPTGPALMALAAAWVLARALVLAPWPAAAAVANVAVPWLAAWGLWRALHAGGNQRNYFFVGLLVLMGLAAGVFHATEQGWVALPRGLGLPVALDLVLFMIAVMGGRVIPMFTNNGVPGVNARRDARVEKAALGSTLMLLASDALGLGGAPLAVLLALAWLAHAMRWLLWQPWKTLRVPLVWVLHLAYAWLLVHLALRAAAALEILPPGPATHALTVGVIGSITLGMMTRTSLGHTGRPLKATWIETTAYLSLTGAALVRVAGPLLLPAGLRHAAATSAALWAVAFLLFLWRYGPFMVRPRADGRPG